MCKTAHPPGTWPRLKSGGAGQRLAHTVAIRPAPAGEQAEDQQERRGAGQRPGPDDGRPVGDVSRAAAGKLRMLRSGVVNAKLEVLGMAKAQGGKHRIAGNGGKTKKKA